MFTLYTLAVSLLGSCTPADTLEVSRMPENFAAATPARVWHTLEAEETEKLPCPAPAALAALLLSEGRAYVCRLYSVTEADLQEARAINRGQAEKDKEEHKRLAETGRKEELRAIAAEEADNSADARKSLESEARDFGRILARDLMTAEKDG